MLAANNKLKEIRIGAEPHGWSTLSILVLFLFQQRATTSQLRLLKVQRTFGSTSKTNRSPNFFVLGAFIFVDRRASYMNHKHRFALDPQRHRPTAHHFPAPVS